MEIIEGPLFVEPVQESPKPASQPPKPTFFDDLTVSAMPKTEAELDDAQVREAIVRAEAQGLNPETLTLSDFSQGQLQKVQESTPAKAPGNAPDIPDKFLKSDGAVDVEKLKASTRQLDEALKTKETEVQKTVDDYVQEYREKEAKFRNLPNPAKLANAASQAQPDAATPPGLPEDQLKARLQADLERDPLGTMSDLIDIIVQKRMQPVTQDLESVRQDKRLGQVRDQIAGLAKSDPRVMQPDVFAAINQKLEQEPELWNLKNPHKAAWLEVKEELRLGEFNAQAQPSKPPSPVLGGGAPASAPSSIVPKIASLDQLNIRDKKQEEAGDEYIRSLLARER